VSFDLDFSLGMFCCNTMQHTATRCNTLQRIATRCNRQVEPGFLFGYVPPQHDATHCNTLQHAATRCNILQHAATDNWNLDFSLGMFRCNTMQHIATRCNTMQHIATRRDTLQQTSGTWISLCVCSATHRRKSSQTKEIYFSIPVSKHSIFW